MSIKLYSRPSDWDGKVESSSALEDSEYIIKTNEMPIAIHRVSVPTKAKMFETVQCRDGVAVINSAKIHIHEVGLFKNNVPYLFVLLSNIHNLDFSK